MAVYKTCTTCYIEQIFVIVDQTVDIPYQQSIDMQLHDTHFNQADRQNVTTS